MSTHLTRLDRRLESVEATLSLVYQFLVALDHLDETGTLDSEAVSALAVLTATARRHVRIVGDALPTPMCVVEVPDDYKGPTTADGPPLQPILDAYRKRAGEDAFATAMHGRSPNAARTHAQTQPPRRRRKAA